MTSRGEIDEAALERARQLGHEPRGESSWGAALWGLGLLALVGIGLLVSYVTVRVLVGPSLTVRNSAPPPAVDVQDSDLQANQELIRKQQQLQQRQLLSSYGWIDQQQGVARIPVRRAIQLLAQRGDLIAASKGQGAPAQATEKGASDDNDPQP